ncbi:MAG: cobalamin-dependent protein, partial [Candidatus Omnitrophica bacterium]|nr:cobalamin-dependent protein [Candidatus Omnitrophota bacterium]
MKVLLLSPPVEDFFFTPQRAYPLGILYLATVMREAGFSVKVVNCLQEYKKTTLAVPQEFSYLKRYYHPNESPFCLFSHFCRFGMSDAEIINEVCGFSPDIVGISANFSAYFEESLGLARLVKHIDKRIVVVIGGRVPTAMPEMALKSPFIDFVVRGEAEEAFSALCRAISSLQMPRIAGVCYKTLDGKMRISKQIRIVKDLDSLPLLDRRLIDYFAYRFQGDISTSLLASRGCAMKCGFCAIREPFRYRSAANVFKEMQVC